MINAYISLVNYRSKVLNLTNLYCLDTLFQYRLQHAARDFKNLAKIFQPLLQKYKCVSMPVDLEGMWGLAVIQV
jgi:hypothetical protein